MFPIGCSKEHVCDIQGLPHASSRATNVSVVFLPNSDCATFDLRVHWDNFHPDDLLRGYEVLLADDNDDNILQCACQSSTVSPVYSCYQTERTHYWVGR